MTSKVCHITTVHAPDDVRILLKECMSLADSGFDVSLVAPGESSKKVGKVNVLAISKSKGRLHRVTKTMYTALKKAIQQKADIYHFHDPELIILGIILTLLGKKVIYDVHEDLPRQISNKTWIPKLLRKIVSALAEAVEAIGAKLFSGIVAATPKIGDRFPQRKTLVVQNFPILDEFDREIEKASSQIPFLATYIGGITKERGAYEMVDSMSVASDDNIKLVLAGRIETEQMEEDLASKKGWQHTNFLGWLSRERVSQLLSESHVGLVVLHPKINYLDSYPIKMFEYMASGIPVIASDFPLWREIITDANCGLLVDPMKPDDIAEAIKWMRDHPDKAAEMGRNGKNAVWNKYNWANEKRKLNDYYRSVLRT